MLKKVTITSKNVTEYLKHSDVTFNPLEDKVTNKTKDFNFTLDKAQPLLKPFQFFIYLSYLPEYFSIEVIGNNEFAGFLLNYQSNNKETEVRSSFTYCPIS